MPLSKPLFLKFTLSRREIDKRMCLGEEERLMVRKRQQNYLALHLHFHTVFSAAAAARLLSLALLGF